NIDRQRVLIAVLTGLAYRIEQLQTLGFEPVRQDWLAYHAYQGVKMSYQHKSETRTGTVVGLDATGALVLESDGVRMAVNSGEVNSLRVVS
ncbi:MAG: hypothetical protein GY726_15785, partial [Proteobacteria bacterium]|nr:hypothetical protein [Pseudomonadota bacterium]